ncbi:MAG: long-chain acyl-CoA synthetase [Halioglobus sp.]|jgi:long-chain acyl-CoA synthetase
MYPAVYAQSTPEKSAVVMGDGVVVSYRELDDRSNQCAQLFAAQGLVKDDAVAFFMHNCPEYFHVAWGAQRSGFYYTPISTHLSSDEVAYIVENCEAKVVVVSAALLPVVEKIRGSLKQVELWLIVEDDGAGTTDGFVNLNEALDAMVTTPIEKELEGCEMLYSSGTTGYPKGIKHPNPERPAGSPSPLTTGIVKGFGVNADTIYFSPAPLYHSAPIRFCMAMHRVGATAVVMEHFEPEQALRLMETHKATFSQWVPTMFIRMLKLSAEVRRSYDLSKHTLALHSAAPCPVEVKEQMIDWWGPVLVEYYGATEGHGGTQIDSQTWLTHKGSVGKPVYGSVHVLDEQNEELPALEVGTVYFAGGPRFEYHKSAKKTAETRVGKMSTVGDVGYKDKDGFLYLTDRKAHMIISGGVNIYPLETENVLVMHPTVADVAVIGVPDDELGEQVKAVVQPMVFSSAGAELERELIDYCREKLSHIKCPRSIDFEEKLPRSDAGKLFKRKIRQRYWEGKDSSII